MNILRSVLKTSERQRPSLLQVPAKHEYFDHISVIHKHRVLNWHRRYQNLGRFLRVSINSYYIQYDIKSNICQCSPWSMSIFLPILFSINFCSFQLLPTDEISKLIHWLEIARFEKEKQNKKNPLSDKRRKDEGKKIGPMSDLSKGEWNWQKTIKLIGLRLSAMTWKDKC